MEKAIFAGGCFWHLEEAFSKIPGIIKTVVGYIGGRIKEPSYEQVSLGDTGHAESIEITFNSEIVEYKDLLKIFWKIHDPTTLNQQGADIGTNYRSAIFYLSDMQKKQAEESKKEAQKNFKNLIVTEITKASKFYPAEEEHQKYLEKNEERKWKKS